MKLIIKAMCICVVGIFIFMSVPAHSEYSGMLSIKDVIKEPRVITSVKSLGDIVKTIEDDWAFLAKYTVMCGVNKFYSFDAVQLGDREMRGVLMQYDSERLFAIMVTDSALPDGELEPDNLVCRSEIGNFRPGYLVLLSAKAGYGSKLIKLGLDGTFISAAKVEQMFGAFQYDLSETDVEELLVEQREFWKNYFETSENPVGF